MKILFVDPPRRSMTGKYTPAIGYLYMATYLRKNGYPDTEILDAHALGLPWDAMMDQIRDKKPDVVATGSIVADIYIRMALLESVKEINPSIITIIGGPHSSLVPEEVLRVSRCIDYVVVGEGEITLWELIRALDDGQKKEELQSIQGLAYLIGNEFVRTQKRPLIEDLDSLPMPDYSLIPVEKYKAYEFPGDPHDTTGVAFSRGCIHPCRFCSEGIMWRWTHRRRSAQAIVEELAILHGQYGKKNFIVGDPDFLFDKAATQAFIAEMKKTKMRLHFNLMSTITSILDHEDIIPSLKEVGTVIIRIGVESYSQPTLDMYRKPQKIEDIEKAFAILRKNKIPVLNIFAIWGSYDDPQDIRKIIIKNSHRLGAQLLNPSIITPIPGTGLHDELRNKKLIENWDYREYSYSMPIIKTKELSRKELFLQQLLFHFIWAYHPARIIRNLFDPFRRHLQFSFLPLLSMMTLRKVFFRRGKRWIHVKEKEFYKKHLKYLRGDVAH